MPKVIFKIPSYEKLSKKVFFSVKNLKEDYQRVIYMKIPKQLVNDIVGKNFEEIKEQLIKEINRKLYYTIIINANHGKIVSTIRF